MCRAADFPETVAAWRGMGEEAGFSQVGELLQAPFDLARVYSLPGVAPSRADERLAHRLTAVPAWKELEDTLRPRP